MNTAITNNMLKTLLAGFSRIFHKPKILVRKPQESVIYSYFNFYKKGAKSLV